MGLIRWFTANRASTAEPTHADLRPLDLQLPVEAAVPAVEAVAAAMGRWRTVSQDPIGGKLHLTRRTSVFQFVDDIRLTFEPAPGGCRVHAESSSRVGTGDFGQNRRNILDLWAAIHRNPPFSDAERR